MHSTYLNLFEFYPYRQEHVEKGNLQLTFKWSISTWSLKIKTVINRAIIWDVNFVPVSVLHNMSKIFLKVWLKVWDQQGHILVLVNSQHWMHNKFWVFFSPFKAVNITFLGSILKIIRAYVTKYIYSHRRT